MANFKLKLKRATAAPGVGALDIGEPGYDTLAKILYIGNGAGENATPILTSGSLLTAGSASVGAIKYNGTTPTNGQLDGSATAPTAGNTLRLNYSGDFYTNNLTLTSALVVGSSTTLGGNASFVGSVSDRTLGLTASSGTDITNYDLILASGAGTGNSPVTNITFKTPTVESSGATVQTLTARLVLDSTGAAVTGALSSTSTTSALGLISTSTTAATYNATFGTAAGSLKVAGGIMQHTGANWLQGITSFGDTTAAAYNAAFASATGSVKLSGGLLQHAGANWLQGITSLGDTTGATYNATFTTAAGSLKVAGGIMQHTGANYFKGATTFGDTTASSSKDSGAVIVEGGMGIETKLYVGTDLSVGSALTVGTTSSLGGDATFTNAANRLVSVAATANTVAGRTLSLQAGNTATGGTADLAGGNLTLQSGQSVGTGTSSIVFQTPTPGTTANTPLNSLATRLTINSAGLDVVGGITVSGNLTVNGTTTTTNSTTVTIDDPIFTLGGDTAPVSDDNKDRGIEFRYYSTSAKIGYFGFDDSTGYFTFIPDATNTGEVFSGTTGTIDITTLTNSTGALTISTGAANGNIDITPNGTGDVNLNADTVRIGDSGANATLTTYGAGDLILNTNGGTSSGSITIADGAAGNITIAPEGTGDIYLTADTIVHGDANANVTLTTNGTGDLVLNTNSGTNSGTITIYDGAAGNIDITPDTTGDINLNADTIRHGDQNANVTLTTYGTGDLILNTNSGTNSGSITIADGVAGNIALATNGAGTISLTSSMVSGTTTGSAFTLNANSLTTGSALYAVSSSITTGKLFDIATSGVTYQGSSTTGLVHIASASTARLTNSSLLYVDSTGTVSSVITKGAYISAVNAGSGATAIALQLNATGTTAKALDIAAGTSSLLATTIAASSTTTSVATIDGNSLTTASGLAIASTSTARDNSSTGALLTLTSTGANGTTAKTVVGERISVTNTNVTSGTNTALILTASGATTANKALVITAGDVEINNVSTGTWNGTAIGATKGGTGQTTWTLGDLLYSDASNSLAKRGIGETSQVLTVVGGVPSWADPSAGVTTFVGLSDTPADYTGDANKLVAVNTGDGTNGTGLEFISELDCGAYTT